MDKSNDKLMTLRLVLIGFTILLLAGVGFYAVYSTYTEANDKPLDKPVCESYENRANRTVLALRSPATSFILSGDEEQTIDLETMLGERPILLEFFSTWCPHCQASVPYVEKFYHSHRDEIYVVSVNAGDPPDEPSTSAAFRKEYGMSTPIAERPSRALLEAYCLSGFPTFYLIDGDGKVVWRHLGSFDEQVAKTLDEILKSLPKGKATS